MEVYSYCKVICFVSHLYLLLWRQCQVLDIFRKQMKRVKMLNIVLVTLKTNFKKTSVTRMKLMFIILIKQVLRLDLNVFLLVVKMLFQV